MLNGSRSGKTAGCKEPSERQSLPFRSLTVCLLNFENNENAGGLLFEDWASLTVWMSYCFAAAAG